MDGHATFYVHCAEKFSVLHGGRVPVGLRPSIRS